MMTRRILVVGVPGLTGGQKPWDDLQATMTQRGVYANASTRWYYHSHGIGVFSQERLATAARDLDANLQALWMMDGSYDEVVLCGHSLGALLIRQAYLNAVDDTQGDECTGNAWGKYVSRFILFAGISRGADMEQTFARRCLSRMLEWSPGTFSSEETFRGSPFITNLRISWIRYIASLPQETIPIVSQILGSNDSIVTREDSIDVEAFPHAPIVVLPSTNHSNVHHTRNVANAGARIALIASAFTSLRANNVIAPMASAREVLMVVHGIRASQTDNWVRRAKETVRQRWPDVVVVAPTYGYLSALRFAIPTIRRRYARFFRDFYCEVVAQHRISPINVLCHSNGTYTVGQSLSEFRAIHLNRIALAGSVLPQAYAWGNLITDQRVKAVRNDCGATDIPVAILCSALRGLSMKDIGTGGFDGFLGDAVQEVRYHNGGHGSMLEQRNLESMLEFLLSPRAKPSQVPLLDDAPMTRRLSRAMTFLAPAGTVVGLLMAGYAVYLYGAPVALCVLGALLLLLLVLDVV